MDLNTIIFEVLDVPSPDDQFLKLLKTTEFLARITTIASTTTSAEIRTLAFGILHRVMNTDGSPPSVTDADQATELLITTAIVRSSSHSIIPLPLFFRITIVRLQF